MKVTERLPEMPKEDSVLRVAEYCRVSTDHEEQDGSLELQKHHSTTTAVHRTGGFAEAGS